MKASRTTNLRESVRETLQSIVQSHKEDHDPIDVYLVIQNEARLLYHTQRVRDQLTSDPFERFHHSSNAHSIRSDIERLCQSLQVVDLDHVVTKMGYVCIESKVRIPLQASNHHAKTLNDNDTKKQGMELRFRYERDAIPQDYASSSSSSSPCCVSYVIELCRDFHGPSETLLWVLVWAEGGKPSHLPAQCLNDDNNDNDESSEPDGWSDMEDDEDKEQVTKRTKTELVIRNSESTRKASAPPELGRERPDRFTAGIDPDVLQSFLKGFKFGRMDDATAFFLLMSFPFYEHEWDIVGYFLDAVFGMESSSSEEEEDKEDEHDHCQREEEHSQQGRKVRRKG